MNDVDRFSQEIIKQENAEPFAGGPPRVDLLYMSQALSPLQPSPSKASSNISLKTSY
jgi:hypothetical protein